MIEGVVGAIDRAGTLDGTRVAVISFNSAAKIEFDLTQHTDAAALKEVSAACVCVCACVRCCNRSLLRERRRGGRDRQIPARLRMR